MPEIDELIESRQIDVRCWHCEWSEPRALSWLSTQRHMACPECASVIVLDTSEVRREIARQRRQLATLREQMTKLLDDAGKISRPAQRPSRITSLAPKLDLALSRTHPDTLVPCMRPAASSRRFPR